MYERQIGSLKREIRMERDDLARVQLALDEARQRTTGYLEQIANFNAERLEWAAVDSRKNRKK